MILYYNRPDGQILPVNLPSLNLALLIILHMHSDLSTGRVTSIDVNSCDDDFTDVNIRFHGSLSAYVHGMYCLTVVCNT